MQQRPHDSTDQPHRAVRNEGDPTPMPNILDYDTPEAFSEALKVRGFLSDSTEAVLTGDDGLLWPARFVDGTLVFVDAGHRLSSLYTARRVLRPDAAEIVRLAEVERNRLYRSKTHRE